MYPSGSRWRIITQNITIDLPFSHIYIARVASAMVDESIVSIAMSLSYFLDVEQWRLEWCTTFDGQVVIAKEGDERR